AALLAEQLQHPRMDGGERLHVVVAARQSRLVGDHDDPILCPAQPRDGLEAAGNGQPLLRRADEVVGVLVDDAVAVKDHQLRHSRNSDTRIRPSMMRASRRESLSILSQNAFSRSKSAETAVPMTRISR